MLENARIRFARGTLPAAKGPDVNVELGSAEVESAAGEVALVTALGVARIERGAQVRVSSDGARSTLEVVVGRAVLIASEGELAVDEGKGARLASGAGRPELYQVVVGAPIAEASAAAGSAACAGAPPPRRSHPGGRAAAAVTTRPARKRRRPARTRRWRPATAARIHVAARTLALRLAFGSCAPATPPSRSRAATGPRGDRQRRRRAEAASRRAAVRAALRG